MSDLKKVFLEKDILIEFSPFYQSRTYGFVCQNFENDNLLSTLHYKVNIVCIESYDENIISLEINRQQIYIDNLAPDVKIEQIADACSQAIFPIRIDVTKEGNFIDITNHHDIKERWPSIKEKLSKYYRGDIFPEIIRKTETVLNNKILLSESICKTWFFHLYFKPLYKIYNQGKPHNYTWESPVFGNQVISYDIDQTLEEHYSATNKIFINIKGNSNDKRSIGEVLNHYSYPKSEMTGIKYNPLDSHMEVQYKLYGEDLSIFSIIGTYNTTINEKKHKTTQIEIYHLPENSSFRPSSNTKHTNLSFFVREEKPVKEKKSFWSKFKLS